MSGRLVVDTHSRSLGRLMLEHRYFQDSPITLGHFRCAADHPLFRDSGPTRGYLIVFPREAVEITQSGKPPVVATPNVSIFYRYEQEYQRRQVSSFGDRCDFFSIDHELLLECMRGYWPYVDDSPDAPFPFVSRPTTSGMYREQRQLVRQATQADLVDDLLWWEEASVRLVDKVLKEAMSDLLPNGDAEFPSSTFEIVLAAQSMMAERFCEPLTLKQIAAEVDVSPYYLCRVFSQATSYSIHQYLTGLRMRSALERVRDRADLTNIAFDLGYSSHSHFTSVFRRTFGETPKQWRSSDASLQR